MNIEELEAIKREVAKIEDEKERRKLEKQIAKIERKMKLNESLETFNSLLGDKPKEKKPLFDDYYTDQEKELMEKEGYEAYQLDEEESELEDDDLYEKGED